MPSLVSSAYFCPYRKSRRFSFRPHVMQWKHIGILHNLCNTVLAVSDECIIYTFY